MESLKINDLVENTAKNIRAGLSRFNTIRKAIGRFAVRDSHSEEIERINSRIRDRIGTLRSSGKPDKELLDYNHKIQKIERMDVLNYSSGDYLRSC